MIFSRRAIFISVILIFGICLGVGGYFGITSLMNTSKQKQTFSQNNSNTTGDQASDQGVSTDQPLGDEDLKRIEQCISSREPYDELRLWKQIDSLNPIYYACLAYKKSSLSECEAIKKWKHKGQTKLVINPSYATAEDFYYDDCRQSAAGALFISTMMKSSSCSDSAVLDVCRQVADTWKRSYVESDCITFCEASKSNNSAQCDKIKSGAGKNGITECKAIAMLDTSKCNDLSEPDDQKGCKEFATFAVAVKSKNPSLLTDLPAGSRYQMLGFQYFDDGSCSNYYQSDLRNLYCNTFLGK